MRNLRGNFLNFFNGNTDFEIAIKVMKKKYD